MAVNRSKGTARVCHHLVVVGKSEDVGEQLVQRRRVVVAVAYVASLHPRRGHHHDRTMRVHVIGAVLRVVLRSQRTSSPSTTAPCDRPSSIMPVASSFTADHQPGIGLPRLGSDRVIIDEPRIGERLEVAQHACAPGEVSRRPAYRDGPCRGRRSPCFPSSCRVTPMSPSCSPMLSNAMPWSSTT